MKPQAHLGRRHRFFPGAHIAKGQNEFLASELDNERTEPTSQEDPLKRRRMFSLEKQRLVVVQLLSHVHLFVSPWTAERQAPQSFVISQK